MAGNGRREYAGKGWDKERIRMRGLLGGEGRSGLSAFGDDIYRMNMGMRVRHANILVNTAAGRDSRGR
jgi:hypothetical protein